MHGRHQTCRSAVSVVSSSGMLGKPQVYRYVVDMLTPENAEIIARSLRIIPDISGVAVHPRRGTVEIKARRDMQQQVRMACDIAKARFRTRV
ncbi:MAG: hypothetical protein EA404_06680 [Spirochaetaceae bacterium]|nr:MAG: hypothetical protein EA404_06680 [Spirochaetaceae bacterium]